MGHTIQPRGMRFRCGGALVRTLTLPLPLPLTLTLLALTMVFCRLKMPEHLPSLLTLLCSLESWVGLGL